MKQKSKQLVWLTPSRHASESMPVGGFNIGANVWFENNELLLYLGRDDSFDENNTLLKSGRLRISFPIGQVKFVSQIFNIDDGDVIINLSVDNIPLQITVWCSQFESCLSMHFYAQDTINCNVSYENWRYEKRPIPDDGSRWKCAGLSRSVQDVYQYPDVVEPESGRAFFYHQNNDDLIIDKILHQQGLDECRAQARDTLKDAVFGGLLTGSSLTLVQENASSFYWKHESRAAIYTCAIEKDAVLSIFLTHQQNKTVDDFKNELTARSATFSPEKDGRRTRDWWHERWENSYIDMHSADGKADEIGRNYRTFRYQLLCNSHGVFPTKFNGGLFTVDPSPSALNEKGMALSNYDADWRLWGGGSFTAQNQRLVYWPMLMNGDFDCMKPQFDFYSKALDMAEAMVKKYWGHRGAAFGEHPENFGLITGFAYGWKDPETGRRPNGWSDPAEYAVPYIQYYYTTTLEFCYMILKYHKYSGNPIDEYFPLIKKSILFFSDHYRFKHRQATLRELDENGHLVFSPSTAAETYKDAVNPVDLVAAFSSVLKLFLESCPQALTVEETAEFKNILKTIPPIPYRVCQGHKCIAPAEYFSTIMNSEIPQLYPVFPYEIYGVGKKNLKTAVNTWKYGIESADQRGIISWHQDNIFVACLGLTDEAEKLNYQKMKDAPNRFPTFWGPGHDWLPDHNWGGSGMLGIQKMLVQETSDTIYLLPAWPEDWDVKAKLYLESQAVIEFVYTQGKLSVLRYLTPTASKKFVNAMKQ